MLVVIFSLAFCKETKDNSSVFGLIKYDNNHHCSYSTYMLTNLAGKTYGQVEVRSTNGPFEVNGKASYGNG
jgi:hypothetical protein